MIVPMDSSMPNNPGEKGTVIQDILCGDRCQVEESQKIFGSYWFLQYPAEDAASCDAEYTGFLMDKKLQVSTMERVYSTAYHVDLFQYRQEAAIHYGDWRQCIAL